MNKSPYFYGVSITATQISAVKLSAEDFLAEQHVERALPPATVSHDGKRILDAPGLTRLVREVLVQLGNPRFDDPVFLSVYPSYLDTRAFSADSRLMRETLEHVARSEQHVNGDNPAIQSSLLWQKGETVRLAFGFMDYDLLADYVAVFYDAGYRITALDAVPLAVIRAMGASGVLDALLRRHGLDLWWGAFGVCGSQTWCLFWRGNRLVHLESFTTPDDAGKWARALLSSAHNASDACEPKIWFAWREPNIETPVDPLQLELNAPVKPAMLGRLYYGPDTTLSFPALGAALREEVPFPLGWDFLDDPASEVVKQQYTSIPYVNYQPVFPKLLLLAAAMALVVILGAGTYYRVQVNRLSKAIAQQQSQVTEALQTITQNNQRYLSVMTWLDQQALPGIQITRLRIHQGQSVVINGQALSRESVLRYIKLLSSADSNKSPYRVVQSQPPTLTPLSTLTRTVNFSISGTLDTLNPPAGKGGQTQ